jgi:hypothetical protein
MHNEVKLKIAQINLARSMAASDDLYRYSLLHGIDIAIVQEPYTRGGKLVNLEYDSTRVAKSIPNVQHGVWAAIIVFNPNLNIIAKPNFTTHHTAVLNFSLPTQAPITVVSSYFQFSKATDFFTTQIRHINQQPPSRFVIGMDVNAYSPWRHDPRRNDKGVIVEQMIMDLDLRVENLPNSGWSFHGARGSSNVDVNTTRGLLSCIRNWSMNANAVSSDHSLITFTIVDQATHTTIPRALRFNNSKIDKTKLQEATKHILTCFTNQGSSLEYDAIAITESVRKACIHFMPKHMKIVQLDPCGGMSRLTPQGKQ